LKQTSTSVHIKDISRTESIRHRLQILSFNYFQVQFNVNVVEMHKESESSWDAHLFSVVCYFLFRYKTSEFCM